VDVFGGIYLAGLAVGSVVRIVYTRHRPLGTVLRRHPLGVWSGVLMGAWGLTQIAAVLYGTTSWLAWADYAWPTSLRWSGGVLYAAAIALLWRSHADLGRAWSPRVEVRDGQTLVTTGVYRYIRHPMYAAHLLWSLGQALMLPNVLAGPVALVVMILFCRIRIPREEDLMLEQFGRHYQRYKARTGRILPRITLWRSSKAESRR